MPATAPVAVVVADTIRWAISHPTTAPTGAIRVLMMMRGVITLSTVSSSPMNPTSQPPHVTSPVASCSHDDGREWERSCTAQRRATVSTTSAPAPTATCTGRAPPRSSGPAVSGMPTLVGNSTRMAIGEKTRVVQASANSAVGAARDVVSRTVRLDRNPATAARAAVGYSSGDIQITGLNKLIDSQISSETVEMRTVRPMDARRLVRSRNSRYWIDMAGMTARIATAHAIVSPGWIIRSLPPRSLYE